MKKISALMVALILVAATAVTAFAAGINSAEQAVLDELKSINSTYNTEAVVNADDMLNQAENYFNTIEMTDAQSKEILGILGEAKDFFKGTGAATVKKLTLAQKQTLLDYANKAAAVVDVTVSYDKTSKTVSAVDKDGKSIGGLTVSTGTNGGTTTTGSAIKTTGADVNTVAVVLGAFAVVALACAAMVYTVKTKKERA